MMEVIVEPSLVNYGVGCLTDCCVIDCPFCFKDCSGYCGAKCDDCKIDW